MRRYVPTPQRSNTLGEGETLPFAPHRIAQAGRLAPGISTIARGMAFRAGTAA